jgi:hypothetical protein
MMRLGDLMLFLGVRNSWARSHLAYRLLWSVFVADRAATRR